MSGNIKAALPVDSQTVAAIYAHHKIQGDVESPRSYLGASVLGHECDRYLWYAFNDCTRESFAGRMYRLFETGFLQEERMAKELEATGVTIHVTNENGKQFFLSELGGHVCGHMDGAGLGILEAPKTWHVLEFKTHNNRSFSQLKSKGVKGSKPLHYAQVMLYMHLSGMKRALYLAVNKDTDELYSERIRYNMQEAQNLLDRARRIISTRQPPERCATKEDDFRCRFCAAKPLCWGTSPRALPVPYLSCRQCCHATPMFDTTHGRWFCERQEKTISRKSQLTAGACSELLLLPGLFCFAEPTDATNDTIEFMNSDGKTVWTHGKTSGGFSAQELLFFSLKTILDPTVQNVKQELDGQIIGEGGEEVSLKYEIGKCNIRWKGPPQHLKTIWEQIYGENLSSVTPVSVQKDDKYIGLEAENGRASLLIKATGMAYILELKEKFRN